MLLNTLDQVLPSKTGKAVTLCSVVGGYLGAFNGFCHLPCYYTRTGLDRVLTVFRAAVGYLVYFSWSIAFVSLFIAATIASSATKLPIEGIVQTMGLLTLPMIIVSVVGFFKILDFDLKNSDNRNIACLTIAANMSAVILLLRYFLDYIF